MPKSSSSMSFEKGISLIIPYRNHLSFLEETLSSVFEQKRLPDEIILVDDCSEDHPEALITKFREKSSVPVIYKRFGMHRGVSAARNEGIKTARFSHVAFLDADDCWSPWHLYEFERALRKLGRVDYYSSASRIFYGSCPGKLSNASGFVSTSYLKLALRNALNVNASSVIFSKSLMEKTGFFDEKLPVFEDIDYWMRAGNFSEVIFNRRTNVFIRRSQPDSLSKRLEYYDNPYLKDKFTDYLSDTNDERIKKFLHLNIYGTIMRFKKEGKKAPAFWEKTLDESFLDVKHRILLRLPSGWVRILTRWK